MSVLREQKWQIQFLRTQALDYPPHTHDDVELVYVLQGSGRAVCDGEPYTLSAGEFFLATPNQVHHYAGFHGGKYILLIVKADRLQSYGSRLRGSMVRRAVIPAAEAGEVDLLEAALAEYERHGDSDVVSGYLTALFGRLLRRCAVEEAPLRRDRLAEVLAYCGQHYREPLTVERVAAALYVSRSHISHIFRRRVGMSFSDYISALRLTEAVNRLEQTDAAVTEIALDVGFSSLRSFDRAFAARYGTTPRAYRQRERKTP